MSFYRLFLYFIGYCNGGYLLLIVSDDIYMHHPRVSHRKKNHLVVLSKILT